VHHDEQVLVVGGRVGDGGLEGEQLRDAQIPPVGELAALSFGLAGPVFADAGLPTVR